MVGGEGSAVAAGTRLSCFTTRPDTLFGVTHVVVAPEHPLVAAGLAAGAQVGARVRGVRGTVGGGVPEMKRAERGKGVASRSI